MLAFALAVAFGALLRRTLPAIGGQYWPLQLVLLTALLALAAAALATGWHATRTRAV